MNDWAVDFPRWHFHWPKFPIRIPVVIWLYVRGLFRAARSSAESSSAPQQSHAHCAITTSTWSPHCGAHMAIAPYSVCVYRYTSKHSLAHSDSESRDPKLTLWASHGQFHATVHLHVGFFFFAVGSVCAIAQLQPGMVNIERVMLRDPNWSKRKQQKLLTTFFSTLSANSVVSYL